VRDTDEPSDITIVDFDADGSLLRQWQHKPDGSEWTSIYERDGTGRLTAVRSENSTGPVDIRLYNYDSSGRLESVVVRDHDEGERVVETYEYDDTGRKTKTIHVAMVSQRPEVHYVWEVEGTDCAYSAPGAVTISTLYNAREQPIELVFDGEAGRVLSRVQFAYDDVGHLVEEAQTIAETLPPEMWTDMIPAELEAVRTLVDANGTSTRRLHRYDAQGRRTETRSSLFGPLGQERKTMVYNDYGDLIEESWWEKQLEYRIDDLGRLLENPTEHRESRSETRYRYDYDARGNWVTRISESRGGTKVDFVVSAIEHRALAYHA
jgi:hypothetical protein